MNKEFNDLARLNFEDFIWSIYIIIGILNICGDYCEKEYIKKHDYSCKNQANNLFTITVVVTFFIYIYFFARNYNDYKKCSVKNKNLFLTRLLGSSFLIAGSLCLLYFQFAPKDNL